MLKEFLRDILPQEGHYCLFLLPERDHLWFDSVDAMAAGVARMADRTGIYFATESFAAPTRRTQENAHLLQALRLDIDAGPEKYAKHGDSVYPTQADALIAVRGFIQSSGIVPSYIVSSGHGLHVYFVLSRALPPVEWLPLARGLAELCRQQGVRVDPSVTTDTARILRPVGTLHSPGHVVRVLAHGADKLSPEALAERLPTPPAPSATLGNLAIPAFLQGVGALEDSAIGTVVSAPSSAFKAAQHCPALAEIAASGGNVPEPQWRAMIGLTTRTIEGVDAAHQWSRGYDGYNPDEVERKFNAWSTGPTTCAEFGKHTRACDTCPHKGKIKSPISLGVLNVMEHQALPPEQQLAPSPPPAAPGMPWEGRIPPGFSVERNGDGWLIVQQLITKKENELGEQVPVIVNVPVTNTVFWCGFWADAETSEDTAQISIWIWNGRRASRKTMEQSIVASPAKLLEWLAGKAIHASTHQRSSKAMQDYVKGQLMLVRKLENPKISDHLGLRISDDGQLICAQGKYTIYGDGHIREALMRADMRPTAALYQVPVDDHGRDHWPPDVWDRHIVPKAHEYAAFLRKHYGGTGPVEKLQLAIMMGFASPFMPFVTGEFLAGSALPAQSSISVSLFSSKAGRGKTAAAKAVLVAFGRASKVSEDAGSANTTENARTAQLQIIGTLPNLMDEMGNNEPRSVANTVNTVANGSPRRQASRDGRGIRESNAWSLVNLITTNSSQRDMIAAVQANSDAIQQRLLEINVDDLPDHDAQQRTEFETDWARVATSCTGAMGAVLHREMCAMGVQGVNDLVRACVTRAGTLIDDQAARFQYRALGAMIAAHMVLARLGLDLFNLPTLVSQFKAAYDTSRDFISEDLAMSNWLDQASRMVQDLRPHTIVTHTRTKHDPRKSASAAYDHVLNHRVPDNIQGRYVTSTGELHLAVSAVKDWATRNGVNYRQLLANLKDNNLLHIFNDGFQSRTSYPLSLDVGLRDSVGIYVRVHTIHLKRLNTLLGRGGGIDMTKDNVVPLNPTQPEPQEQTAETVNEQ